MTQIFLVRHGQSEGNLFRRVQGQTDVELTADGKAQLPYLTKRFAETPLAAVYTSPLRRAEETAAAIVGGRDIPVFVDKRLIEMCFGAWEMRPWGEVNLESPELKRAFLHDPDRWHVPGSEAHTAVQKRMLAAMTDIARANDGKTVAVASHGMAIRAFLACILGVPSERIFDGVPLVNNTSVTLLRFENDTFSVLYVNDTTPRRRIRPSGKTERRAARAAMICATARSILMPGRSATLPATVTPGAARTARPRGSMPPRAGSAPSSTAPKRRGASPRRWLKMNLPGSSRSTSAGAASAASAGSRFCTLCRSCAATTAASSSSARRRCASASLGGGPCVSPSRRKTPRWAFTKRRALCASARRRALSATSW